MLQVHVQGPTRSEHQIALISRSRRQWKKITIMAPVERLMVDEFQGELQHFPRRGSEYHLNGLTNPTGKYQL